MRRIGERWQPGFLTAGHAVPGGASTAVVELPRWRPARRLGELYERRSARRIGEVALHNSPLGDSRENESPGFDYAVVDLDHADPGEWDQSRFVANLSAAPRELGRARQLAVVSGVSGYSDELTVDGALFCADLRWKDSWILTPATALRKGDSGSCAYVYETGETFGMVVARVKLRERAHHFYVQSTERLLAECLPEVKVQSGRSAL